MKTLSLSLSVIFFLSLCYFLSLSPTVTTQYLPVYTFRQLASASLGLQSNGEGRVKKAQRGKQLEDTEIDFSLPITTTYLKRMKSLGYHHDTSDLLNFEDQLSNGSPGLLFGGSSSSPEEEEEEDGEEEGNEDDEADDEEEEDQEREESNEVGSIKCHSYLVSLRESTL